MISMRSALKTAIVLAGWLASAAQAAPLLLEKITQPGFVMPAYAITKTCAISSDGKMTQTYTIGAATSKKLTQLVLGSGIGDVIIEAEKGKITQSSGPVDTPTVIYNAYRMENGRNRKIILSVHDGGSGIVKENNADAARLLQNFIDLNCGDPT
jgi:hypothetical protein